MVQRPYVERTLDICIDESAARFREHSLVQPGKRDPFLRAGTSEAKDAVLIAQIPTTMVINPATAAAQAKVSYTGNPQFAPIEGTSMKYATNTADKVIQVGDVFYLCLQGVWFISTTPQRSVDHGEFRSASDLPIPPSSPVYNVTYVTQVTNSNG